MGRQRRENCGLGGYTDEPIDEKTGDQPCSTEFKNIKDCKKRPGKVAGIVKTEAEKCGIDINAVRTRPKLWMLSLTY